MKVILAIDGGGSRTRCFAIDEQGRIVGIGSGGPSNHLLVPGQIVRASLESAIADAITQAQINKTEVACISAGLAGVDFDGTGSDDMESLLHDLGFSDTTVSGDMVIAHAGALAEQPGVLALAGTGSSVLGIGVDGTRIKVGGWGPIFGDEGSAYRIGQAALRAAARDFDGRGPRTGLTAAVVKELGLSDFKGSIKAVYLDQMQPREIARLSEAVDAVAKKGDEAALNILKTAGAELAGCVAAAIRKLGISDGNVRVSYQGSVIVSCKFMRESFCASLEKDFAGIEIERPRFPPGIGAYLLGRSALGLINDDNLFSTLCENVDANCK